MFIVASVIAGIVSGTVFATVKTVQKRERLRQWAKDTEHLDIIPTDVRRAAAMSGAEFSSRDESPDSGGGYDAGDGDGE